MLKLINNAINRFYAGSNKIKVYYTFVFEHRNTLTLVSFFAELLQQSSSLKLRIPYSIQYADTRRKRTTHYVFF